MKESMRSILAPLENCSETGFEFSLRGGEVWRCFPKLVSYLCDTPGTIDISFNGHGAGRCQAYERCAVSFEDMVQSRKRPNRVPSATTETRKKVETSKEVAGMVRKSSKEEEALSAERDIELVLRAVSGRVAFILGEPVWRDKSGYEKL